MRTNCPAGSIHADSCSNAERSLDRSPSARRPIWSAKVSISSVHPHLPAIGSADTSSGASATAVDAHERHGACSCVVCATHHGQERVPDFHWSRDGERFVGEPACWTMSSPSRVAARRRRMLTERHDVIRSPTRRWLRHRRTDDLSVPRWSKLPASAPSIETLARTACGPARLSLPPKRFTRLYTFVNGWAGGRDNFPPIRGHLASPGRPAGPDHRDRRRGLLCTAGSTAHRWTTSPRR